MPRNQDLHDECVELFEEYLERTKNETLILMPKKDLFGNPLLKPNANRFNNEEKRIQARIRFENIFGDASRKYHSAIMLTLTSGQWHRNIFEDTKKFQENFNKLITCIRKEAKDQRIADLVKRNPEFLRVRISKNYHNTPGGADMSGYEYSSDMLTPHDEKPLTSFLEAAESFQIRTRTARRHKGMQGRTESDAQYFKRIRSTQKAHNVTASELREAAAEYIKQDFNLKLPYLCVWEFQRNGNVHYHIIIFGISWLKRNDEISRIWQEYGQGQITKINKISWNEERGYTWAAG
jgi:ribosomal protein S6E (S10)